MPRLRPYQLPHVEIDGVDVTDAITSVEITYETEPINVLNGVAPVIRTPGPRVQLDCASLADLIDRLMGGGPVLQEVAGDYQRTFYQNVRGRLSFGPWAPYTRPRRNGRTAELEALADWVRGAHAFEQDPAEQATLCVECGMWPEHHNHQRRGCVCADCIPDAEDLPEYDSYYLGHVPDPEVD